MRRFVLDRDMFVFLFRRGVSRFCAAMDFSMLLLSSLRGLLVLVVIGLFVGRSLNGVFRVHRGPLVVRVVLLGFRVIVVLLRSIRSLVCSGKGLVTIHLTTVFHVRGVRYGGSYFVYEGVCLRRLVCLFRWFRTSLVFLVVGLLSVRGRRVLGTSPIFGSKSHARSVITGKGVGAIVWFRPLFFLRFVCGDFRGVRVFFQGDDRVALCLLTSLNVFHDGSLLSPKLLRLLSFLFLGNGSTTLCGGFVSLSVPKRCRVVVRGLVSGRDPIPPLPGGWGGAVAMCEGPVPVLLWNLT